MATNFPQYTPSGRSYGAGDFPVKTYRAQDGAEVRLLYGDRRVGMTLNLTYNNLHDDESQAFLNHYHEMKGTYQQFELGDGANAGAKAGWTGDASAFSATAWGARWRYSQEPTLSSVYPGRSTVNIQLIAVSAN
jgi:hypothetical protein